MGGVRILSKYPKDQKNELIGLIRKHYSPPHDNLYEGEKVFSRSEDNYVTECGKRDKTEGFRQRQRNLSCGYFSIPSRPYQSVGEPVLKSLDLLVDTLGDCLPQKFYDEIYAKQEGMGTPRKLSYKERRYTQTILYERDNDLVPNTSYLDRQERKNQNVGMKCIKSVLSETELRITACKSGQSYVSHVTQCQDRARDEANKKLSRRNEMFPDWGQNTIDFRHSLKVNSLVKKLECISIIMHSLHNMRTKHLKSRNPMTAETVMLLRKDPFAAREFAGVATATKNASRNQLTLHTPGRLVRPSLGGGTLHTPGRLVRPSIGGGTHKSAFGRNTRTIIKLMQGSGDSPVTLETWDDLVNVGTRNKILHLIRKIPPWQQTITTTETFLARKRNKEKKDEEEDEYDVDSVVENFQLEMQAVKKRIQKHTEQELEKIERERIIKFKYKLSSFVNTLTLYETHSATLAEITRRINRAPELSEEEKTTRWYQALMEEVKSISATADPDVCHKIAKLERFALEETTDIYNVNEKLCLLTLSLPIHEICTFEMQSAITFVLKEILDVRVELMEEWMRHRHLRSNAI